MDMVDFHLTARVQAVQGAGLALAELELFLKAFSAFALMREDKLLVHFFIGFFCIFSQCFAYIRSIFAILVPILRLRSAFMH